MQKQCSKCGELKDTNDFYAYKRSADGLRPACKKCMKAAERARYLHSLADEDNKVDGESTHTTSTAPTHKQCSRCGESKPLNDFYAYKRSPDGLRSMCKDCMRVDRKERYRKDTKPPIDPDVPDGHKRCNVCGVVQPTSEFFNDARTSDGLSKFCDSCDAKDHRERYESEFRGTGKQSPHLRRFIQRHNREYYRAQTSEGLRKAYEAFNIRLPKSLE